MPNLYGLGQADDSAAPAQTTGFDWVGLVGIVVGMSAAVLMFQLFTTFGRKH